jgi:hypothetical protein
MLNHATVYVADLDAGGTRIINSQHFTLDESFDIQDFSTKHISRPLRLMRAMDLQPEHRETRFRKRRLQASRYLEEDNAHS